MTRERFTKLCFPCSSHRQSIMLHTLLSGSTECWMDHYFLWAHTAVISVRQRKIEIPTHRAGDGDRISSHFSTSFFITHTHRTRLFRSLSTCKCGYDWLSGTIVYKALYVSKAADQLRYRFPNSSAGIDFRKKCELQRALCRLTWQALRHHVQLFVNPSA